MGEGQITNRLSELRALHRLTQKALAVQVGVARQTIVAIEKGQYNPSLLLAFKIAHCFGEPLEAVFQFRLPCRVEGSACPGNLERNRIDLLCTDQVET